MHLRHWKKAIVGALTCLALAGPAAAQSCPDLPGFAPLDSLPVYDGACLFGAEDAGFTAHDLVTGPMKGREIGESMALEGTLQRRLYVAPEGTSAFDLFSNYRNALTQAGFDILFQCIKRECGSSNALLGKLAIYGGDRTLRNLERDSEFALYIDGDEHYLAARSADGTRHVAIYVAQNKKNSLSKQSAGRAAVHIDLITSAALEAKMIDAAAMAKGITDEGHVALDNVYFDFGTATLSPEAAPAIAEMVKLLTDNPGLKVYIVGHTDWIGDPAMNQVLSEQRAEAVVAALVQAGIAGDRLGAAGMGLFAPRASNATEEGRTLNRRVELVERAN
jgi:outer membrane protein OmpA-like peptidoglycan-associated protein